MRKGAATDAQAARMSETPTKRKRGPGVRTSSEEAVAGELGDVAGGVSEFYLGGVSAGSAATGALSEAVRGGEDGWGDRGLLSPRGAAGGLRQGHVHRQGQGNVLGASRTLSAPAAVVDGGRVRQGQGQGHGPVAGAGPSTSPSSASGVSSGGGGGAGGAPRTPESKARDAGEGGTGTGTGTGVHPFYLPPRPTSVAPPEGMLGDAEEEARAPQAILSRFVHLSDEFSEPSWRRAGQGAEAGARSAVQRRVERMVPPRRLAVLQCRWRQKEKVKTTNVALVLCLNLSVDPPDLIRIDPCARLECWVDPTGMKPQQATELIGKRLLEQYERWQGKARYKISLDPTLEDVRKLCASCRKNAHQDRVLFHYNGHGVPRTTPNGEIWVFNSKYTQYIPLSFHTLRMWVGKPALYIFDCSSAGYLLQTYAGILSSPESEGGEMRDEDFRVWKEAQELGAGGQGATDPALGFRSPAPAAREGFAREPATPATTPRARGGGGGGVPRGMPARPGAAINLDTIMLCACRVGETLPQGADVPADVFTACLTTPIPMALRWVIRNSLLKDDGLKLDLLDKIPGKVTDRKSPLGEINWIFTTVTDTIAWNVLPRELFQKLFRQDLLLATLFRNFLLAERVMRDLQCTPCSYPPLPRTFSHPMWQAWDLAAEMCLARVAHNIRTKDAGGPAESKYPWLHPQNMEPKEPGAVPNFMPSSFFSEQLTAFEIWLDLREGQNRRSPEQLPIVLQVLLSQNHRLRALTLLARFLDMGTWAVELSLSVGIFPYVLKLLQSPAGELRRVLVFIWAKILAWDASCKVDLVKDRGHIYFISFLSDESFPPEQRALAAFTAAVVADAHPRGQAALLGSNVLSALMLHLTSDRSNSLLRQWAALCVGRLCAGSDEARLSVLGVSAAEADDVVGVGEGSSDPSGTGYGGVSSWGVLIPLLTAPEPETRASIAQALGLLVRPERGPIEPEGRRTPRSDMMMDVGVDGRVTPRRGPGSGSGTPLQRDDISGGGSAGTSTDLEAEQAELDRAVRSNDFFSALTGNPSPAPSDTLGRSVLSGLDQQLSGGSMQPGSPVKGPGMVGDSIGAQLTRRGVCELALVRKLLHISLQDPCHLVRVELVAALHRFCRTHWVAMGGAIEAVSKDGSTPPPTGFSGTAGMSSPMGSADRESPLPGGAKAGGPSANLGSKEAQDRALAKLAKALYTLAFDPHGSVREAAREVCTELGVRVYDATPRTGGGGCTSLHDAWNVEDQRKASPQKPGLHGGRAAVVGGAHGRASDERMDGTADQGSEGEGQDGCRGAGEGSDEDDPMGGVDLTESVGASERAIPVDASGIYEWSRSLLSESMLPLALMYDPKLRYVLRKRYDQGSFGWERDVGPKSSLSILREKYERMLLRGPHMDVKRAFAPRPVAPRLTLPEVQSTMALRAPPLADAAGHGTPQESAAMTRLALMRCKPLVVSTDAGGQLRVYDYATGCDVRRFSSGTSPPCRVTGLKVLNEEAVLYSLDHPKTTQPPLVDPYFVDPQLLVLTGSSDGVVRVWGNAGLGGSDPVMGDAGTRLRLVSSWCALEDNVWQDTARFEVSRRDRRVFRAPTPGPNDGHRNLAVEYQRAQGKVYVSATHRGGMVSSASQSTVWVWDLRSEMQATSMSITNFSTVMLSQGSPESAGITCMAAPPVPFAALPRDEDVDDDLAWEGDDEEHKVPQAPPQAAPPQDNGGGDLAFPPAHVLVCGCTDGSVRVLDDRMPGAVQQFTNGGRPAHAGPVVGLGFSSLLGSAPRRHGPPEPYDPSCRPSDLELGASQKFLVTSGSRQGDVKVWDFRNMHWSLGGNQGALDNDLASAGSPEVVELAVHPLLASVATRTADGAVNLWDVRGGGEQRRSLGLLPSSGSPVTCMQWHSEKHLLAAGGANGEIRLFGETTLPLDSLTHSLRAAGAVMGRSREDSGGRGGGSSSGGDTAMKSPATGPSAASHARGTLLDPLYPNPPWNLTRAAAATSLRTSRDTP